MTGHQGKKLGNCTKKNTFTHTHTEINSVNHPIFCFIVLLLLLHFSSACGNGSEEEENGEPKKLRRTRKGHIHTIFIYKGVIHHQLIKCLSRNLIIFFSSLFRHDSIYPIQKKQNKHTHKEINFASSRFIYLIRRELKEEEEGTRITKTNQHTDFVAW